MSAPSIPNLLSLRGGLRGRGPGRRRGRGGHTDGSGTGGPTAASTSHDVTIQGTDTDAAVSRMSAVDLGYLEDPFAEYFVQKPVVGGPVRRLPIINRGTYTRTTALDLLVESFLSRTAGRDRQIVSLGAGTDTRCFRLFSRPDQAGLVYHEIDFPTTTGKKLQLTRSVPALRSVIPDPEILQDGNDGSGNDTWGNGRLQNGCSYWCHGLDLRDLAHDGARPLPGLRTDVPTLVVSECCLCYLDVAPAEAVLRYFAGGRAGAGAGAIRPDADLAVVVYEPIRPDDAFGRTMVANLAARQIRMPTLAAYGDPAAQEARLRDGLGQLNGAARALTIRGVWDRWVSGPERERVDALEGLDEVEEWNLLADHYVVAWGWRGEVFEGWGDDLGRC
ncbi:leucine carboxyl methyltransferase [Xylariomycetidae sp. FL2044]|nr:leucine carboxyl methyltransferase [Xylariomycetidae sp. FL2044]